MGPALAEFYARSRIVVVPSKWFEGFRNVIAEAMACGKPVVAARIGAIPEIVDEGVTGLLFEPGNDQDLSEKIQFLSDRPQKCQEMGRAALRKARTDYGEERFYDLLTSIYKKATQIGNREYNAPFTA
jgi:glycosyltransferase involved in cell wall biosynthesis